MLTIIAPAAGGAGTKTPARRGWFGLANACRLPPPPHRLKTRLLYPWPAPAQRRLNTRPHHNLAALSRRYLQLPFQRNLIPSAKVSLDL